MQSTEPAVIAAFQVELESDGTACRLLVGGALCERSIALLEAKVDELGCLPCQEVIVDLRRLTQLDAVGANVILGLYHYVVGRGGTLCITRPPREVAAVLHSVAGTVIPFVTPEKGDSPTGLLLAT
jgi:anti-anti-sigma regulatory factor